MTFKGGVHPPCKKQFSSGEAVEALPLPGMVFIPLSQHIGAPAEPSVKKGDSVKAGQKIGAAKGFVSAPVHASVSGKVAGIKKHPHPVSGSGEAIIIEREGDDRVKFNGHPEFEKLSGEEIKAITAEAGIAGMGGACFPTAVKLSPPEHAEIDTLIINGAECEPYLSSDYRVMLENPAGVITGAEILMRVLKPQRCIIAVEENKPDAAAELEKAAPDYIEVILLPVKYPQGGEKQLISALLGREVPSGGLPMDAGAVVQNAGTALAVKEAVIDGKPLFERVVSVTGENIKTPKNLRVRLGTPFKNLIDYCGGFTSPPGKLIAGGPMMGIAQHSLESPAIKGTSGLLCFSKEDSPAVEAVYDCIRCGSCVDVCPAGLIPSDLARFARKGAGDLLRGSGLEDCIECGCCSYSCPSKIPIVHYIKYAKAGEH